MQIACKPQTAPDGRLQPLHVIAIEHVVHAGIVDLANDETVRHAPAGEFDDVAGVKHPAILHLVGHSRRHPVLADLAEFGRSESGTASEADGEEDRSKDKAEIHEAGNDLSKSHRCARWQAQAWRPEAHGEKTPCDTFLAPGE